MNSFVDDMSQSPSSLLQLPNELWSTIFSYLTFTDLCQLRLVNKKFYDISTTPQFKRLTKLVITEKNLYEFEKYVKVSDNHNWMFRNVELNNIHSYVGIYRLMKSFGHNVHYLHLFETPFLDILENLSNLTELIISGIISAPYDNIEPKYLEFPKTLKSIIINTVSSGLKIRILERLIHDNTKYKLERLEIGNIVEKETIFFEVLNIHKSTLKHLSIFYYTQPKIKISQWQHMFQDMQLLETIQFVAACPFEYISKILSFLPESAPVKFVSLQGTLKVNNNVVMLILKKWPKTIKYLDLSFTGLEANSCLNELSNVQNNLKVLDLSFCPWVNGAALIKGICADPNYSLRQLLLNDLDEMEENFLCTIIERLPNLNVLSLENCRKGVTNNTLAKIFQHQTKLQTLILNDCMQINDCGLIGFDENSYSISRLKGLRKLGLRGCMKITDKTLLNGLFFQELRSLKLGYCYKITNVGFSALVVNCPTLESLTLTSCKMVDDYTVFTIAVGLKRLQKLNLSNCINITNKSIDYIMEYCNLLRKLIMYGLDSMEVEKARQRLKQKQPYLKRLQF